jgi:magnesium transporter
VAREGGLWRRLGRRLLTEARDVLPSPGAWLFDDAADHPEPADRAGGHVPARRRRGIDEVIGDCALYVDGRRRPGRVSLTDAGRAADAGRGFVWIGLQQPSADDIAVVAQEFGLPALAVEDAVKAHQRPKLEVYDDVVFAVLKPVHYVDHDEVVSVSEVAVFVGRHFVVTVRHGDSDVLRRVRAEFDAAGHDRGTDDRAAHELAAQNVVDLGPLGVLYRTADLVVDGYEDAITCINDDVDEIEMQVFADRHDTDTDTDTDTVADAVTESARDRRDDEGENSERIYKLKREVAEFRRAVAPLALPLQRLAAGTVPGVDRELAQYFRDVHDHVLRAADGIDGHDRLLTDVLQADLARGAARQSRIALRQNEIAVRQNEDMRKISAWAAIALVPTAIAGIYGMNFDNMPELRWHYGYFAVLAVIGSACLLLHRSFRRNGWL